MRFTQYDLITFVIFDTEIHEKYVCQFSHFMLEKICS